MVLLVKNPPSEAGASGDAGSIPGLGRFSGDKGGKTAMLGDGYLGGGGPVIDPFSVTFYMLDISHHKRFYSFIYSCTRSSLLHVGRGDALAVGRLLIAVVSHIVEQGL